MAVFTHTPVLLSGKSTAVFTHGAPDERNTRIASRRKYETGGSALLTIHVIPDLVSGDRTDPF